MALKPNSIGRLTLHEITDYKNNSGITNRQYQILKRKFYDSDEPTMEKVCLELNISTNTYNRDLKKAFAIIERYKLNTK